MSNVVSKKIKSIIQAHIITAWSSKNGWIARFFPKYECALQIKTKAGTNEHHKLQVDIILQTHHFSPVVSEL